MDLEKEHHETVEDVKSTTSVPEIDRAAEKRLLWKLDIHVVPILMFLFLLAFLDRINIGNARLQGLEKDLGMEGHDYNIALFIFFIPYILFEVPSNLVLRKVPPSWWLSGIMFFWGISTISNVPKSWIALTFTGIITISKKLKQGDISTTPGYLMGLYVLR